MKKIVLSIVLLFSFGFVFANNNPKVVLKKEKKDKELTLMVQEIGGAIQLYSTVKEVYESVEINENDFREIKMAVIKEYYIGNNSAEEVELIIPGNFKKVAKKYFADTPELAKRIGKRGFRYENLPFMILYHNKIVKNGGNLTVVDVKKWQLLN
ncbi:MAG: hypothetical protein AB8G86_13185 [Saprospiraceae bacterium]